MKIPNLIIYYRGKIIFHDVVACGKNWIEYRVVEGEKVENGLDDREFAGGRISIAIARLATIHSLTPRRFATWPIPLPQNMCTPLHCAASQGNAAAVAALIVANANIEAKDKVCWRRRACTACINLFVEGISGGEIG